MQARHARTLERRALLSKEKKRLRLLGHINLNDTRRIDRISRQDLRLKYGYYKWVSAPKCFSLIDEPEKSIAFINKINQLFRKNKKVFIDLEHVEEIGHGAIVVLLALMVQFRSNHILFNGSFSKKEAVNKMLRTSGFFDNLSNKEFSVQDTYDLSPVSNSIYTHAQRNVNPELSDAIIKKASSSIWGGERRCTGVQRVFLELMQNTNNHASLNTGEKHWWVSINYNKKQNKVCFSFIDFGIGIFESLLNKKEDSKFYNVFKTIKNKLSNEDNSEMLRLLLNGEVHKTATGKYYRGKGLPGVFNASKKDAISNLIIISNDAYANIANNKYKNLNNNLAGTFIYWELNENNRNII